MISAKVSLIMKGKCYSDLSLWKKSFAVKQSLNYAKRNKLAQGFKVKTTLLQSRASIAIK